MSQISVWKRLDFYTFILGLYQKYSPNNSFSYRANSENLQSTMYFMKKTPEYIY